MKIRPFEELQAEAHREYKRVEAIARAFYKGRQGGRPGKADDPAILQCLERARLTDPTGNQKVWIAAVRRELGVSRSRVYEALRNAAERTS